MEFWSDLGSERWEEANTKNVISDVLNLFQEGRKHGELLPEDADAKQWSQQTVQIQTKDQAGNETVPPIFPRIHLF